MNEKKIPAAVMQAAAAAPSIASVPWDRQLLKGRECGNCACYFQQPNPANPVEAQGFCRRQPADMQQVRVMETRKDLQGNVVMRDGKPVEQPATVIGYLFKPTKSDGVCFDGWRPLGTLPGEQPIQATIRETGKHLAPLLEQLPENLRPFIVALFGLHTETHN